MGGRKISSSIKRRVIDCVENGDLPQHELARILGISTAAISQIKNEHSLKKQEKPESLTLNLSFSSNQKTFKIT